MASKAELLGIFAHADALLAAIFRLKESGGHIRTVFSPVPLHEIQEALKTRPSPVRYCTLLGGILGVISGFSLASYSNLQWSLITGGKPVLAWVPFVVVGSEFTILLGVFFTIGSMLIISRLPRFHLPGSYDRGFSVDRFGVLVECGENEKEKVSRILKDSGAEEVREPR